ncbi:uncharacterized protein IL334_005311 [Kwoniella shivajii]|uniref:FAS1 domain-containing protein n=1 Tax=Kwoniella shivajii TaxID=564305 RepID=A0ABZ1D2T0_9TREE|nr:hypothetical protein IL334_005311 [Kwoniella shivajii]
MNFFPILLLLSLLSKPAFGQQQQQQHEQEDDIICPDESLTTYLHALIDVLYANGLNTFEQLIVHHSEIDSGYEFLHNMYTSGQKMTLLVPTDQAFQQSGIVSPFNGLTDDWGTELGELHCLQGEWTYDKLPNTGHGIASTSLLLVNEMNSTDVNTNASQALVLERGGDNQVIVDGWYGNATSWSGPLDLSSAGGVLGNLVILPIDQVLSFPPSLSTALSTPGLTNMSSALSVVGKSEEVEQLTEGGFTIFVPVDSSWSDDIKDVMVDQNKAPGLVGNHYTTKYSLFSSAWTGPSTFELDVESGEKITIKVNEDGSSSVVLGEIEAKIIRSDVTLDNGVLHMIDKVLYPTNPKSSTTESDASTATSSTPSTASSTSTSATIPDGSKPGSNGNTDANGKAVIPDSGSNSASRFGISWLTLGSAIIISWITL